MPYRAQLGGEFGGGVARRPSSGIDIGGAIDALTGGAAGLIHQAYTRRAQEHEQQRQDAQLTLEREREDRQREHEGRMELASGILRGGTTVERVPDAAAAPGAPAGMPSIRDAFAGASLAPASTPAAAPGALETPVTEGALGTVPRVRVTSTPDRYDPDQDRTRVRTLDAIGARGDVQSTLEAQRQGGRVDLAAARHTFKLEEQADAAAARATQSKAHDGRVTARAAAAGNRPLSANGQEVAKKTLLDGLVGYHSDEAKLREYLTTDDVGKASVEKYGITDADIAAALGRAQSHVADEVVRAAGSRSPERAATRVRAARDAAKAPPTPVAPPATAAPATAGATLPPLSKAERDRAAADPDYKAFKMSKGYTF